MTSNNFTSDKDKHFDHQNQEYALCNVCKSNGYPKEKVVYQFEGFRSEDEDGFIYKYTVFNYPVLEGRKIEHEHKYNQKLIDQLLHHAVKERHATERLT